MSGRPVDPDDPRRAGEPGHSRYGWLGVVWVIALLAMGAVGLIAAVMAVFGGDSGAEASRPAAAEDRPWPSRTLHLGATDVVTFCHDGNRVYVATLPADWSAAVVPGGCGEGERP